MPQTASGRFWFIFLLGLGVLAVAVLVLWMAPALEPGSLGNLAL